ncbi:MAG TPA: homoserine dehydrogenase [Acidimicrobiales bacterium]|nr:homoserine dehydrogenase [Acidimicrobiales bacterium]
MSAGNATPPVRVGLLGCGNVGGALLQILESDAEVITARTGLRLEVTRVAVRNLAKERQVELADGVLTHDAAAVATAPEVDVVVEVIGGIEPARGLILSALKSGKPVVTANKELMANVGSELVQVAAANNVDLLYEASVGGGIPLIRALRESLAGERVRRLMGIVNGTTNYILTRMTEEGTSYAEALAEAQSLGYAERDPTADVEGFDAGAKAAILATIAFGVEVVAGDVYREGISGVTAHDIGVADRLGYVVKLLALAEQDDTGAVAVRVHPAMLPKDHPLAAVRGSFNAVFVEGDAVGELMFYGRGAGGPPSASAVLGDLIDAAHNLRAGGASRSASPPRAVIRPIDELRSQYYLSIDVLDRPGVLAAVAQVFGGNRVSIRSMEQTGLADEARLIFITHTAREADVQATITGLHQLDVVKRVGSLLRVAGPE